LYVAANQEYTRQWWAERRQDFELYASAVVVQEVRRGTPDLAASRLAYRTDVGILGVSDAAETLKEHLLTAAALPRNAELDALHIAVAAVKWNGLSADLELSPYRECGNASKVYDDWTDSSRRSFAHRPS
jgi:hypothetical protein